MAGHARLAPSSAGRWVHCPGSVALEEQHPETGDRGPADAGHVAHAHAAALLSGLQTSAPSDEIAAPVAVYVDYVRRVQAAAPGSELHIERPVPVPAVHPDCWGTPDAVLHAGPVLHVFDYKHGWGIVEAVGNWQLTAYAGGALQPHVQEIHLHVAQPRPWHREGPCRVWRLTAETLRERVWALNQAAAAAVAPNPPCVTGPHCRYCRALHACCGAERAAFHAVDVALNGPWPDGGLAPEMTPDRLSAALHILRRAQDMIAHRVAAVEQAALALPSLPGWERKETAGRMEWTGDKKEIKAAAALMGVDVTKEELITPTQAIKAGIPAAVAGMYSARKPGRSKLEPIDFSAVKNILRS